MATHLIVKKSATLASVGGLQKSEKFWLGEIRGRLATPCERPKWDAAMDEQHCLGFRRFAGRGLRYVAA